MFPQAQLFVSLKKRFQGFQLYFINSLIRELFFLFVFQIRLPLQTEKQNPNTLFCFLTEILQVKRVSLTPNINKNY